MLNFSIQQFKRFDGTWGSFDQETENWNGMITNLINGEADFAISPFSICCRRPEVVDFLWTLSRSYEVFVIKGKIKKSIMIA